MGGLKLGQYMHGDSLLHLLDPRVKIISCLIIIIAVLLNYTWYYLSFFLLLMIVSILIAGMDIRYIAGSLRTIRYLLLVTFIFQAVLTPGEAIVTLGKITVTYEGLRMGTVNLLRLTILYLGSLVLLMTTSPLQISSAIEYLLLPLSKLKIPVHNFSTILSIAFRFLPTLAEETVTIKKAQTSRGARFDAPGFIDRLKSYLAILVPLFEASLARAEDLGEAMDSRCYRSHPNQLRMSSLAWKSRDTVILLLMLTAVAAGWIIPLIKW